MLLSIFCQNSLDHAWKYVSGPAVPPCLYWTFMSSLFEKRRSCDEIPYFRTTGTDYTSI